MSIHTVSEKSLLVIGNAGSQGWPIIYLCNFVKKMLNLYNALRSHTVSEKTFISDWAPLVVRADKLFILVIL